MVIEARESQGVYTALIGDLPGPSMRLGDLESSFSLKKGDSAMIILDREPIGERAREIPVPLEQFFREAEPGDVLLMDDGRIQLRVEEVGGEEARVRALTDAEITSRKALVIKGKELSLPALSPRDLEALSFSASHGFDFIGLSYVRNVDDIATLRSTLAPMTKRDIGVIAKIETPSSMRYLSGIVEAADAILVARGDLGMFFSLEAVPRLQERIVETCLEKGKPVIVPTQLLGSMLHAPLPTRSEIVDVLTAIREGVDMLMLTGETAVGWYPIEAVKWLRKIIESYEPETPPKRVKLPPNEDIWDRFAEGIAMLAESLGASIAVYSKTGITALRLSRSRPNTIVYAASSSPETLRRISIAWGVRPLKVQAEDYGEGLDRLLETLSSSGELKPKEILILTYGLIEEPVHIVKIIQL